MPGTSQERHRGFRDWTRVDATGDPAMWQGRRVMEGLVGHGKDLRF